jgi:hypothetical protein
LIADVVVEDAMQVWVIAVLVALSGMVGKPAAIPPETLIYSNSFANGLFMQNDSIGRWTTQFKNRDLAIRFYLL